MSTRTSPPAPPNPALRGWLVSGIIAGSVGAGVLAFAAAATAIISRTVVVPPRRPAESVRIHAVDLEAGTLTLAADPDTILPGRYSLFFGRGTGHAKIGEVLSIADGRVTRVLESVDVGKIETARWARFSGWYYLSPVELDVPVEDVVIPTEVGQAPAWYVPAPLSVDRDEPWAILVHGRNVRRGEAIRAVPVLREAGYHCLLISYRNDRDAPASNDGRLMLGGTEWRDVESAIEWSIGRGARRVLLMGWSMGGALVLQTVTRSRHRPLIEGVILDSPVINWAETLQYRARAMGLPAPVSRAVRRTITEEWGSRITGLDAPIDLERLDFVTRAEDLDLPVLLLHSDDDGYVASTSSRLLAEARPDIVEFVPFAIARHTKLWNLDPDRWNGAIRSWLRRHDAVRPPCPESDASRGRAKRSSHAHGGETPPRPARG